MSRWMFCWTASLLLSGCASLNQAQFQIPHPSDGALDRDRVVAVVRDAATSAGMVDRTDRSKAAHTLVYFEEPVKTFRTTLGARDEEGYFVIDLVCFHYSSACDTPTFSYMKKSLSASLAAEFGSNWKLVTEPADRISVTRSSH